MRLLTCMLILGDPCLRIAEPVERPSRVGALLC